MYLFEIDIFSASVMLSVSPIHLTQNSMRFIMNEVLRILQHSILWHRVPCITTMENGIHHIGMYGFALYRDMQIFGATLKFDPHYFVFNWIIQTILVAFSMKTLKARTGMLASENDDFKFIKNVKNIKASA